jgi:hypothetical protein
LDCSPSSLIAALSLTSLPFIVAGGLKSLYDILLYISFQMSKSEPGESQTTVYTRVGVNAADLKQQQDAQPDTNLYDEEADGEAQPLRK